MTCRREHVRQPQPAAPGAELVTSAYCNRIRISPAWPRREIAVEDVAVETSATARRSRSSWRPGNHALAPCVAAVSEFSPSVTTSRSAPEWRCHRRCGLTACDREVPMDRDFAGGCKPNRRPPVTVRARHFRRRWLPRAHIHISKTTATATTTTGVNPCAAASRHQGHHDAAQRIRSPRRGTSTIRRSSPRQHDEIA